MTETRSVDKRGKINEMQKKKHEQMQSDPTETCKMNIKQLQRDGKRHQMSTKTRVAKSLETKNS